MLTHLGNNDWDLETLRNIAKTAEALYTEAQTTLKPQTGQIVGPPKMSPATAKRIVRELEKFFKK